MKQKWISLLLAVALCISTCLAGCTSAAGTPGSKTSSSVPSEPEDSGDSSEFTEEKVLIRGIEQSRYEKELEKVLKGFGETNPIENLVPKEEEAESDEEELVQVFFSVGDRNLCSYFRIDGTSLEVSTIAQQEDPFHYYYYPGAESINELGLESLRIHVYDYNTEEELDTGASSSVSRGEADLEGLLEAYPEMELESDSSTLTVISVNLKGSDFSSIMELATQFYSVTIEFLTDFMTEYSDVDCLFTFNIRVDNELIGFMAVSVAPSFGIFGTYSPTIIESSYENSFQTLYELFLGEYDFESQAE